MKIGVIRMRMGMAIAEPTRVRRTAWCPRPLRRKRWPGIVDSAVSSSGAPR